MSWLDEIAWNAEGLVPAIAQDARTGQNLMMAWMNRESLEATLREGRAIYWSRSRRRLWRKGEESGHVQHLRELRLDCDGDTVLLLVEQEGSIACHTGRVSCFYRRLEADQWQEVDPVVRDPRDIYQGTPPESGSST
ncbi:MAG: phosphoribosyl-AMP cyclohydrolase [Pseudomonadota bacterium]